MRVEPDRFVRIGVVGRPHGVRGALKVHLDNPKGRTLVAGRAVRCVLPGRTVDHVVQTAGGGVVTFVGLDDRTVAEALVHAEVQVRRKDLVGDGDGVFLVDLVGAPVVDGAGGPLGSLKGFIDTGAQLLGEVATPGGRVVLVPFVAPILVQAGPPIVLAPPGGLFNEDDAIVADDEDAPAATPATKS
jgi:16S rRNA processing protein RimM